jgi:hypothetical protein
VSGDVLTNCLRYYNSGNKLSSMLIGCLFGPGWSDAMRTGRASPKIQKRGGNNNIGKNSPLLANSVIPLETCPLITVCS